MISSTSTHGDGVGDGDGPDVGDGDGVGDGEGVELGCAEGVGPAVGDVAGAGPRGTGAGAACVDGATPSPPTGGGTGS
jgi:hypothetical protein